MEKTATGPGPHTLVLKLKRGEGDKGGTFDAELRANLLDSGVGKRMAESIAGTSPAKKRGDQALRRSEQEYRRMVEIRPDGIAVVQDAWWSSRTWREQLLGVESPDELWALIRFFPASR